MPIPITERIKRYKAWLNREESNRPLIGLLWEPDIPPLPDLFKENTKITPDMIDPALFMSSIGRWFHRSEKITSDTIQCFCPAFGIPWVEAITGCELTAYPDSYWAKPSLKSYKDREPISFDLQNIWLNKLVEFTKEMVRFSDGRFPVALPQMRGPLDTLAAMRTPEQLCIDMIEYPEEVKKILGEIADLWIMIANIVLKEIPPFYKGYSSRMKMWAPDKAITPQNDISTLLSPYMYKDIVLSNDIKIVEAFPFHCFHNHSSEYHNFNNLLEIEKLTSIQVTLENTLGGPDLELMMPVLRKILEEKPLLLVPMDLRTADICIRELPHKGLAVMVALAGDDFSSEYDEWVRNQVCTRVY